MDMDTIRETPWNKKNPKYSNKMNTLLTQEYLQTHETTDSDTVFYQLKSNDEWKNYVYKGDYTPFQNYVIFVRSTNLNGILLENIYRFYKFPISHFKTDQKQ